MSGDIVTILFFIGCCSCFVLLYVVASFSYAIVGGNIVLRRKILGFIPFGKRTIPLSIISDIRRFGERKDWFLGADIYGNLFWRPGVIVFAKKGFCRRIYITPSDPEEFVKMIRDLSEIKAP